MKGMKENQILVVIKEPGKEARVEPLFDNTLKAFQKAVDGYIEAYTVTSDVALICNEEGLGLGLPYNCHFCHLPFYGTVIAVGVKGEEFVSLRSAFVPVLLRKLKEEK